MLFVSVASPRAHEQLVRDNLIAANVRTRTTVVLQTFYERRPIVSPA
jgi:Lrp/AsnC family leucine-responsive transcriptional regulator